MDGLASSLSVALNLTDTEIVHTLHDPTPSEVLDPNVPTTNIFLVAKLHTMKPFNMKIFMEKMSSDLNKISRGIPVNFVGINKVVWLELEYENLPDICFFCGRMGHSYNNSCMDYMKACDEAPLPPYLKLPNGTRLVPSHTLLPPNPPVGIASMNGTTNQVSNSKIESAS
uniref:Zinc knuckle CX2CX4HX4C domain-containing protein n=1 Tax=Cannabis sativa TaxID=3483 RepID=A0A803Q667_CANSA